MAAQFSYHEFREEIKSVLIELGAIGEESSVTVRTLTREIRVRRQEKRELVQCIDGLFYPVAKVDLHELTEIFHDHIGFDPSGYRWIWVQKLS